MTASGAAARQAAAGGLTLGISCSEFPRVPYHKRHEQPCDGRSQLATAPCEPGDEQEGTWPRDQLVRMDARFVRAVERAIANGEEHPKDAPRT
jgi:hypothetical protein